VNPAEELLAALAEIVGRVDVFGFEYELGAVAKTVWTQNAALIERLMAGRIPDGDETSGASLWRTKDGETGSRWFVLCVDDGLGLRERGTWGSGVPRELVGDQRTSLIERHLSQMLNREDAGRSAYEAHYGLGAELRRGGDMRLRIGNDG
jgi:hypothetical protein